MAGALSGHIIDSYYSPNRSGQAAPFTLNTPIVTHGAMSFNPQMHGTPSQASFSFDSNPSFMDLSDATTIKIATLQSKLNQKLGPEYISQRPGPSGGKLTYAEGWKIINLANEVFGFNGWSSNVVSLTTDFIDFNEETRRFTVGVTAIMRVTLRDGVYHEDIGYGMLENSKSKGAALDKCKKEAVTDGLKRALRNFGNLLGNCLYDKSYTQEVVKIKVPPPKFDKNELHRRPEFDESKPSLPTAGPSNLNAASNITPTRPPTAQVQQQQNKPLSSLPSHMRPEVHVSKTVTNAKTAPAIKSEPKTPNTHLTTGLNTPGITPVHQTIQPAHKKSPPLQRLLPQQEHPPGLQERKVTFAPPPIHQAEELPDEVDPLAEESFNFNSDDEAFFAAVDLGEGDMGRPIDHEEGLGCIGEESSSDLGVPYPEKDGFVAPHADIQNPPPLQRDIGQNSRNSGDNGENLHQDRGHRSNTMTSNTSPNLAAGILPNASRLQQQVKMNAASTTNHQTNSTLLSGGQAIQHHNQNQIVNTESTSTNSTNTVAAKRATTPSIGGFHFPPGVNPMQQQHQRRHTVQAPSSMSGQGNSGGGTKRSVDVMQGTTSSTSTSGRRPGMSIGMGLQHAPGTGQRREILGRLDVGEGGDVKRMKH